MNGVGDAFSLVHWGTHFLVQSGDFLLGIDCPDSYRRALAENAFEHRGAPVGVNTLDAMIITHLHGDHVNGLEMTVAYRRFTGGGLLPIHTTEEVASQIWDRRIAVSLGVLYDGTQWYPQRGEDFFELHTFDFDESFEIGPLTITARKTVHHIAATALKITDGEATLGYSCDTAYDPELIAWLEPCDLIIHESSHGPAHTPIDKLEALPQAFRDKLLVAHYPDELIGTELAVTLAEQGATYEVTRG